LGLYSTNRRPSSVWKGDGSITPASATGRPGTVSTAPFFPPGQINGWLCGVYGPVTVVAIATPMHRWPFMPAAGAE